MEGLADLEQVEMVEREVWGLADRDTTPLTLIIATKEAGSIWVGANSVSTLPARMVSITFLCWIFSSSCICSSEKSGFTTQSA